MQKEFGNLDLVLRGRLNPLINEFTTDNLYQGLTDNIQRTKPLYVEQYIFDFYPPFNHKTSYYLKLIEAATHKCCNSHIDDILESDYLDHQVYLFNSILERALSNRLIEVSKIIRKHQFSLEFITPGRKRFSDDEQHQSNTFIFQFLQIAYLKCYLEIQASFNLVPPERKKSLETLNSFYIRSEAALGKFLIHRPQLKVSSVKETPEKLNIKTEPEQESKTISTTQYPERNSKPFQSFESNKTEKWLATLIKKLDDSIGLIDHSRTSVDAFAQIMASSDIHSLDNVVYLNCETKQFRYIIDRLSNYFENLTLTNIEKSRKFYTKNNKLLTASNLSRSRDNTPKEYHTIDRIFTAHCHQN